MILEVKIIWWNKRGRRKIRRIDLGPIDHLEMTQDNRMILYPFDWKEKEFKEERMEVEKFDGTKYRLAFKDKDSMLSAAKRLAKDPATKKITLHFPGRKSREKARSKKP